MHLVDSHCHLDFFADDRIADIVSRAEQAGLGEIVTIGTRLSRADQQKHITGFSTPQVNIWCTVGTHPEYANTEPLMQPEDIVALTHHPKVIGIGETGLDFFYGEQEDFASQEKSFRNHIRAAQLMQLPVCIHAREADDAIASILKEETERGGRFPFLIHCFTSGLPLAETVLELGGYISISGIATFKKAQDLRDIIVKLPFDRILVETDSPYLAPVPHRGKENEPAFVSHTAAYLAELREIALPDFINQTTENFHRLFTKAKCL